MTTTSASSTAAAQETKEPASPKGEARIPFFGPRELAAELGALRARTAELGVSSVAELQERKENLEREIAEQTETLARERDEATTDLERRAAEHRDGLLAAERRATEKRSDLKARLVELRAEVAVTEESAVLQEVGIYEYRHPLADVAYQAELKRYDELSETSERPPDEADATAV